MVCLWCAYLRPVSRSIIEKHHRGTRGALSTSKNTSLYRRAPGGSFLAIALCRIHKQKSYQRPTPTLLHVGESHAKSSQVLRGENGPPLVKQSLRSPDACIPLDVLECPTQKPLHQKTAITTNPQPREKSILPLKGFLSDQLRGSGRQ